MNRFRELLLDHPFIAKGIIFPFALAITLGMISFFIEVIVPVLFAIGLTYWIYHTLIGNSFDFVSFDMQIFDIIFYPNFFTYDGML